MGLIPVKTIRAHIFRNLRCTTSQMYVQRAVTEAHAYFAIPTGWPGCGRSGNLVDACNAGIPQGQHVIDPTHDAIMAVN
jgi:hypothetical protein